MFTFAQLNHFERSQINGHFSCRQFPFWIATTFHEKKRSQKNHCHVNNGVVLSPPPPPPPSKKKIFLNSKRNRYALCEIGIPKEPPKRKFIDIERQIGPNTLTREEE